MAIWQGKSKRKASGKRLVLSSKKRKYELGRVHLETRIGQRRVKTVRVRGGHRIQRLLKADSVNVYDKNKGKAVIAKIQAVIENQANPHYVRRGIITKGTIVETDKGKVKITNRPGREGALNGVFVE